MRVHKRVAGFLLGTGFIIMSICGSMNTAIYAAETTDTASTASGGETTYKLDREVQEWLDAGNSIPANAKYATLSSSSHLWALDSTDISDGKVELYGLGDEVRVLSGIAMRDWLKTQTFYGENLGEKNNKIEFIRPKKKKAF
mgnify:CR=1 FL=1